MQPAAAYALGSDRTAFTVDTSGPGVIVLTETYYKNDFEALVDGQPVPYFRVNHAFKGIYLDTRGTHRVSFRYWPEHFTVALWLAAGGLVLLALPPRGRSRMVAPMTDRSTSHGASGWGLDGFLAVALILFIAALLLLSVSVFVPR